MGMFDRLIVGIDGSEGSLHALRWASAQIVDGEIIAVHGFSPGEQLIAAAAQVSLDGVRSRHYEFLQDQWIQPASDFGIKPRCEMFDDSGANALMTAASTHGSATIVVGHEGRRGWPHQHVGSTPAKLLHRCDDPLIITTPDTNAEPLSGPIVVGISGSADLDSAHMNWSAGLAQEMGLTLNLVGVNQPPTVFRPKSRRRLSIPDGCERRVDA